MRTKVQDALDWLDGQIDHPTPTPPNKTWYHLCMSMARRAWDQLPWGLSANIAWNRVPKKYRHHTTPDKVPAGAFCFGLFNTTSGHCWIAGRGTLDKRIGFTVDYKRKGHVDRAPLNLPAWTRDEKVWWTAWTPFGFLKLWKDPYNKRLIPMPAAYKDKGLA
jgi:hypothetical protein